MNNWIQNVDKEMDKKGTVGAFTKQANNAGMSVQEFAKKVKDNPSEYSETTRKRAQFALNMEKIAKNKKMAKGGVIEERVYALDMRADMYQEGFFDMRADKRTDMYQDEGSFTYNQFKRYADELSDDDFMDEAENQGLVWSSMDNYMNSNEYNENGDNLVERKISVEMRKADEYVNPDFLAKGGKTQKFNDKLNEDLGERLGRESGYSQSLKDRRDESKAGNKTLGRRAYSSVKTMDKGDRMFMQGGETQGYDDRDRESIGERNRGKKSQSLDSRMRESAGTEKSMGRRKYADVSTMDKGKRKMAKGGYVIKGRTKNKNFFVSNKDMPFKSKAEAEEYREDLNYMLNSDEIYDGKNSQERLKEQFRLKDNIKEFYTEKQYARGGSVKGKIDRDRYVKLRREKDKEIAKLKKEKGALRKETITNDKCDDKIEKVEAKTVDSSKDNNNQTLLVGGIAGILFGAFLLKR